MKRRAALFVLAGAVALVVAAGVAYAATVKCQGGMTTLCVGTDGPDTLYGTAMADAMNARQGDDLLLGRRGADHMLGDTSSGQQDTTDGNDQLYGNRGKDWLLGYGGNDLLNGGHANDEIYAQDISTGNPGEDTVIGGGGNDSISANDGLFDSIDCGDGLDVIRYDTGLDEIENCEFQNP